MRSNGNSILKGLLSNSSGNATLLVALGLPALIGGTGLAVDTAQWYMWKRELQYATDQAALGAARALSQEDSADDYELRAQQEFAANISITQDFASKISIAYEDYAGGDNNSVIVTANATKPLPFSGFLTGNAAKVAVESQATFGAGDGYHACIIATAKTGTGIDVTGNATVQADCGLASFSCSGDAITIGGSSSVTTKSIAACGTVSVPSSLDSVVTENVRNLSDPLSDLPVPDNPTTATYNCEGKGQSKTAAPTPGTYTGGLKIACETTFASGIYVINGGTLDLSANHQVTGEGVMFVLKGGAQIQLGGQGNADAMHLSPMPATAFVDTPYEANKNRYSDILVFEDRTSTSSQNHIINGNTDMYVRGTVYLPNTAIKINGTANLGSNCLQIIANRVNVLGTADVVTDCAVDQTNFAGGKAGGIRLVDGS